LFIVILQAKAPIEGASKIDAFAWRD